jgi:hypothetical protein
MSDPALHLPHDQARFAVTEPAYQEALTEIRNGDAGDAITDAGTALQAALMALGCKGTSLGPLLMSARERGLIRGNDSTPPGLYHRSTSGEVAAITRSCSNEIRAEPSP